MSKNMWMIRAGRSASLVQDFEEKGYVSIGWSSLGDLRQCDSKEELEEVYQGAYPDNKPAKRRMSLGQICRFRFEIQIGDYIIT